mmetsp:Transcript_25756/g.76668  ORF Transcript_25756/g.76668 Transcript_25756/m.76668 type:complete len:202 (+) Transcript_25756:451-1056(+)
MRDLHPRAGHALGRQNSEPDGRAVWRCDRQLLPEYRVGRYRRKEVGLLRGLWLRLRLYWGLRLRCRGRALGRVRSGGSGRLDSGPKRSLREAEPALGPQDSQRVARVRTCASSSNFTHFACPAAAAAASASHGRRPDAVGCVSTDAPACSSCLTASARPFLLAMKSGVRARSMADSAGICQFTGEPPFRCGWRSSPRAAAQ